MPICPIWSEAVIIFSVIGAYAQIRSVSLHFLLVENTYTTVRLSATTVGFVVHSSLNYLPPVE